MSGSVPVLRRQEYVYPDTGPVEDVGVTLRPVGTPISGPGFAWKFRYGEGRHTETCECIGETHVEVPVRGRTIHWDL